MEDCFGRDGECVAVRGHWSYQTILSFPPRPLAIGVRARAKEQPDYDENPKD
jgi:hypothetical protein